MSAVVCKHLAAEKKSVQMNELLFTCWCALTLFYLQTFAYKCNFCSLVEKCSPQGAHKEFFFFSYLRVNEQVLSVPSCSITPYWAACLQTSTTSSSRPFRPALSLNRYNHRLCCPCFCLLSFCSEHMLDTVVIEHVQQFSFLFIVHFQLEQFNMIETPISSDSLYNQTSTLNYSQALMMGLTGGHCNLQDSQQLGYSNHSNIPNIILTGAALTPCIPFNLA